jgi:hypothetical protein
MNGPVPDGMTIDHLNENKFDNRLENLRICTIQENLGFYWSKHRKPKTIKERTPKINHTSKYRGVHWHIRDKVWQSKIYSGGKSYFIGYFKDEIEAALSYDIKAIELLGSESILNFLKFEEH